MATHTLNTSMLDHLFNLATTVRKRLREDNITRPIFEKLKPSIKAYRNQKVLFETKLKDSEIAIITTEQIDVLVLKIPAFKICSVELLENMFNDTTTFFSDCLLPIDNISIPVSPIATNATNNLVAATTTMPTNSSIDNTVEPFVLVHQNPEGIDEEIEIEEEIEFDTSS